MKLRKIACFLCSIIMTITLFSCKNENQNPKETVLPATETTAPEEKETSDEELRKKIGRLFVIRPEALDESVWDEGAKTITDTMRETYNQYPCGGFALFKKNITDEEQLTAFTAALHSLSEDIFLSIDEEGGLVARLANHEAFDLPKFDNMQIIAEKGDYEKAYELGVTIGSYLEKYGLDADFAPVADVNTNPDNTVIGVRAFGDDPEVAAEMVTKVIEGLHESNTLSCIKHFPGHGDTASDTHTGYAQTLKTWEEMLSCEMITFKAGIAAGTDMVMIAHISAPNVTGNDLPATLSYTIVTEKLRNELGFNGVVITDAMEMGAITTAYSSAEATLLAIEAGVDIILMPQNYKESFDAVFEAVKSGRITEERIDESIERIDKLMPSAWEK